MEWEIVYYKCETCYGKGTVIKEQVGLGQGGFTLCFAEQCCPDCYGAGYFEYIEDFEYFE